MTTYSELRENLLIALYQDSKEEMDLIAFPRLVTKYGLQARPGLLAEAQRDLKSSGLIIGPDPIAGDETAIGQITGAGLRYIENKYGDFNGVGEILSPVATREKSENESEPDRLLAQIIPASDRLVSPSHNAPEFASAVAKVEEARAKISESNLLEIEEKQNVLINIDAGLSVLKGARDVAVGALRYLILDRLKSAFEGIIEDAFKVVLITAFLALGAYILTLV